MTVREEIQGQLAPSESEYSAFISYSHQDRKFAEAVLNKIERYRLPKALAGRPGPQGPVPRRLKLYRDRDESRAAADLSEELQRALQKSQYLVVVCSRASARVRPGKGDSSATSWVNEELRYFQHLGRADRILTLIKDGEPNAPNPEDECYPPALKWKVDAQGEPTGERAQPLSPDARPGGDGFHNAVLKIIARLSGVEYDELKRRDALRRRREAAVALAVAAVFVGALAAAWNSSRVAETEGRAAKALARAMPYVDAAAQRRSTGSYGAAALLSAAALAESEKAPTSAEAIVNDLAMSLVPSRIHPRTSNLSRSAWNGSTLAVGDDTGHLQGWQWSSERSRWECAWLSQTQHGEPLRGAEGPFPPISDLSSTPAAGGAFVSAGQDGTVRAWRASDGEQLWKWDAKDEQGHAHRIVSVAVEPAPGKEEPAILAGDADGGLWILPWEPRGGARRWQAHKDFVRTARWQPGGKMFASASADGTVRLWDREGHEVRTLTLPSGSARMLAAAFSPDGRWIAAGGDAGVIGLWEVATGALARQIKALEPLDKDYAALKALAWVDGRRLASAAADGRVLLWDATSGDLLRELLHSDDPRIYWIEPLRAGQVAITGSGLLSIGDVETGRLLHRMDGLKEDGLVFAGDASHDKKTFAVSSIDRHFWVRVFDMETLALKRAFPPPPDRTLAAVQAFPAPSAIGLSADGGRIAWAEPGGAIRVSAVSSGETLHLIQGATTDAEGPVVSLAWSTDGKLLASCSEVVRIWNAAGAFEKIRELRGPSLCAFIPGTERVATVAVLDHNVRIWNARSGTEPLKVLEGLPPDGAITSFTVSPDGRFIAAGTETGLVGIWNTRTFGLVRIARVAPDSGERPKGTGDSEAVALADPSAYAAGSNHRVVNIAFSPGAAVFAIGLGDGSLRLIHSRTGNVLAQAPAVERWRGSTSAVGVEFTAAGRLVTVGADDGALRQWDRGWALEPAGELSGFGHESAHALSAAPDGSAWLASVGAGDFAKVWDAQGKSECDFRTLGPSPVSAVAWLNEGTRALFATTGGELVVVRREGGQCTEERRISPPLDAERLVRESGNKDFEVFYGGINLGRNLPVIGLAVDQERQLLASAWIGHAIWLLDLRSWQWRPKPLLMSTDGQRDDGFFMAQAVLRPGHSEIAAIDRSGRVIAESLDGRVLWEAKGGSTSLGDSPLGFSPDGKLLAVGGQSSHMLLLDADSGAKIGEFRAHDHDAQGFYRVASVAWLRKDSLLATAGADNTLRLWDASDPRNVKLAGLAPVFSLPFTLAGGPPPAPATPVQTPELDTSSLSPAVRAQIAKLNAEVVATVKTVIAESDARMKEWKAKWGESPEPDDILAAVRGGLAVARDDRTIAVGTLDGVVLFDADALRKQMQQVTPKRGPALSAWVQERTGLRLEGGQRTLLRHSNWLVPEAQPPAGP